ncbi:MAG: helix-turn-helix transcriptional regulator, partial [Pseudomonadota bacterium]
AHFRMRLGSAMTDAGVNRSALARMAGVDRSTLTQLLADGEARLPSAQLVAECAAALGVSTDWLLGMTERRERPGDLIAATVAVAEARRSSVDEQILAWHREARGYKIRHVPATLPDILKTEAVLRWEYAAFLGKTPEQAIGATLDGLALLRAGGSDYEIAVPRHELDAMAAGEGYYRGLPREARQEQCAALAERARTLYPSLRLHAFDARRLFSAPVTVFGPLLAVVYVGKHYLAFRSEERVRALTGHFDWLVRECEVDARAIPAYVEHIAPK